MIHVVNEYDNIISESSMNELISNTQFRYVDSLTRVKNTPNGYTNKLLISNLIRSDYYFRDTNKNIILNINTSYYTNQGNVKTSTTYSVNVIIDGSADNVISKLSDDKISEYLFNAAAYNIGIQLNSKPLDYNPIVHRYKYQSIDELEADLPSIIKLIELTLETNYSF